MNKKKLLKYQFSFFLIAFIFIISCKNENSIDLAKYKIYFTGENYLKLNKDTLFVTNLSNWSISIFLIKDKKVELLNEFYPEKIFDDILYKSFETDTTNFSLTRNLYHNRLKTLNTVFISPTVPVRTIQGYNFKVSYGINKVIRDTFSFAYYTNVIVTYNPIKNTFVYSYVNPLNTKDRALTDLLFLEDKLVLCEILHKPNNFNFVKVFRNCSLKDNCYTFDSNFIQIPFTYSKSQWINTIYGLNIWEEGYEVLDIINKKSISLLNDLPKETQSEFDLKLNYLNMFYTSSCFKDGFVYLLGFDKSKKYIYKVNPKTLKLSVEKSFEKHQRNKFYYLDDDCKVFSIDKEKFTLQYENNL